MNHFPFPAIVGLELAKRSLIYHAIDPRLGGTLLLGHRGCAKSTLARAFAAILPAKGDGTDAPFIEVPLGTTDDRLLGSVDAGSVLEEGKWRARSGLIEQAHEGVLYIDEINLLPDHLADFILDSAATGQYRMERDGLTTAVNSRYILIGSMNPEEGDLRPQLTDRFAHGVRIRDDYSAEERVEIVKRRMSFDDEGEKFPARYEPEKRDLQARIRHARTQLGAITIQDSQRASVAESAKELRLEGIRAELAVLRTARAAAAWNSRDVITEADIEEAWTLCLGHRINEQSSAQQPPPASQSNRDRTKTDALNASAQFPIASHPEPRKVESLRRMLNTHLLEWWNRPDAEFRRSHGSAQTAGSTAEAGRHISWIGSLSNSLRHGWNPGGPGWRLRYASIVRKQNVWILVDASRSSGARQFLGTVAGTIRGVASRVRAARFHMLVLRDGRNRWVVRRATEMRLCAHLRLLDRAMGPSFLGDAVTVLRRAIVRGGAKPADRVLVCTDGFVSPRSGQTPVQAIAAFRESVRRVCLSGARVAWLHPAMPRGMKGWINRVRGSIPISPVEVGSP